MPARRKLLTRSATVAARSMVGKQLQDWLEAYRELMHRRGRNGLHDFRVALRRLRSTLRAFRPFLLHPKGMRRRLRRLAQTTNESRNLEIWRAWVSREARALTGQQRIGVRWLTARLNERRRRADELMQRRISKWLPRLRKELRQASSVSARGPAPATRSQRAGAVVGRVLRTGTSVLVRQLGQVNSMRDRDPAHAARIAAKRLRYLLESFENELPGTSGVVAKLEELQTLLGEVHDAHIFADELRAALAEASVQRARTASERLLPWPGAGRSTGHAAPPGARAGLLTLARRLREDGERRFGRLQRDWLRQGDGVDALVAALNQVARRCVAISRGGRI